MKKARRAMLAAIAATAVGAAVLLAAAGCQDSLGLKAEVQARIDQEKYWLHGTKSILNGVNRAAALAVSGPALYALYFDQNAQQLKLIESDDRGKTWGSPFTVASTIGSYGGSNSILVEQSIIYILYERNTTLYFIQLTDTGSSFTTSNARTISSLSGQATYGSMTMDAANIYIAYSDSSRPAFSYAARGSTISFVASRYIDSDASFVNQTPVSIYVDSASNVNVAYCPYGIYLKNANFAPGDVLPMTVSSIAISGGGNIADASHPSIGISAASRPRAICFYDSTSQSLSCYHYFSFSYPPLMLGYVNKVDVVDNSSADIGWYAKMLYTNSGNRLLFAYLDRSGMQLKFAIGTKHANNPPSVPPAYSYSNTVVDSLGGSYSYVDCSLAADGDTVYILYYDPAGSGALKLAKSSDGGVTW